MNQKRRQNRRDRRKAKASKWRRAGTVNPRLVDHHPYENRGVYVGLKRKKKVKK